MLHRFRDIALERSKIAIFGLTAPTEVSLWDVSVKFLSKGHRWPRYQMAWKHCRKFQRLSRVHECYRRQTDGRAVACSERERDFTFAKNDLKSSLRIFTALHVMQTRYSEENSVRLSVCPSVRLSHACIVTKRN